MKNLEYYRDLLLVLTHKELKVRYKSSLLGYFWSVAQPLFLALIYFLAFKIVMRITIENYTVFLLSGLFPWQWFSNSITASPVLFLGNANLIKKAIFPREAIILADVLQNMIHFLISIPVLVIFLFIYNKYPSLTWLYGIPILLLIQFLMITGIALTLSSINLFFRDLERLTGLFIIMLFFTTPVFYTETMIPEEYSFLLYVNPLAPLMISWRNLFLEGAFKPHLIVNALAYSLVVFLIGYYIYKGLKWRFAEVL